MGSGASIIAFANSLSASWTGTLKIYNWSGTPWTGGGTDELFFGNDALGLNATQLLEIQFYSGNGTGAYAAGALILANGEVVPVPGSSNLCSGGACSSGGNRILSLGLAQAARFVRPAGEFPLTAAGLRKSRQSLAAR